MKKIYLSVLLAGLTASGAMAQATQQPFSFNGNKIPGVEQAPSDNVGSAKALGVTFWVDTFSNAANWTIDNAGETAPFGWNIGNTVNSWWTAFSGGINSTSGNEFAEIYNGDYNAGDQKIGVVYNMTSAAPIDVWTLAGGTDQVVFSFEQYGAIFNDGQEVQLSTDGTNFTTVYTNNDRTTFVGNNPSAIFGNPETISVNVQSVIAPNPTTVWIRFTWTSRFPTDPSPVAWTTFGWFLDDVAFTTSPDNDITAGETFWGSVGLHYGQIPLTQVAPIEFTTIATNNGSAIQTDVQLNVDINSGAWTGSSPAGIDITAGNSDSLVVSTLYTPSALGTYNGTWTVSQIEVDDVPADNDNTDFSFDVTTYTYARDNGTQSGSFFNGGDLFIVGSYYDVFAAESIYSVDVMIDGNTEVGSIVRAQVYWLDPAGATLADALIIQDESDYYTITSGDLGQMINLDLIYNGISGTPMTAGDTYFIAVASDGDGGATNDVVIGTAGESYAQTSFLYDGPQDTWFYTTNTPIIRMNLDPASTNVGLGENSQVSGVTVFPNPTTDELTIHYSLGASSDVLIEVVDITGKAIATYNEGTQAEGSHAFSMNTAAFAGGIYYVTISSGETTVTKKVVKR